MTEIEQEEIIYKLVVTARMSASNEVYKKCLSDLTELEGFSFSARDEKEQITEYRKIIAGKTKCRLQISPKELAVETSNKGVKETLWKEWSENILEIVSPAMEWSSKDLAVLATVHKYRFPKIGNNYQFLRDTFLVSSKLYELMGNLKLFDIDIVFKSILEDNIKLFVKITSNQQMDEILSDALDDEDNRIIFEFHAVRLDLKQDLGVVDALRIQEEKLKVWLGSGKLDIILKTFKEK